ncbi:MAG: hypothetical protein ACFFB7_06125, partial [Candidatus Sifarchaeia archaeon]
NRDSMAAIGASVYPILLLLGFKHYLVTRLLHLFTRRNFIWELLNTRVSGVTMAEKSRSGREIAQAGRHIIVDRKMRIDWIFSKIPSLDEEHLRLVEGVIRRFLKEDS